MMKRRRRKMRGMPMLGKPKEFLNLSLNRLR